VVDFVSDAILGQSVTTPPPVTSWEVTTAIDSLNSMAAPGQDGLSMAIVKECFPSIKLHLLFIFNVCFNLQYFPDCWKTAKFAIIGKPNKPDYDSLNSFRPISLVNNLAKILEKIILSRLQWNSSQLKWISPNQHGFSPGKSTESSGHALISFIEKSRLDKQTTAVAFLDIKKFSHLRICINGVHIKPSPETVFLGFNLDAQLKWVSHLNAKVVAARKAFFGVLSCLLLGVWTENASSSCILLTWNQSYCMAAPFGPLWAPWFSSKAGIKKGRSCQRIFLIATIGAFKTVSTEALLLLNSASPIDFRVAKIVVIRFRACSYDFSPASLKWLFKPFPSIASKSKIDHVSHFTSSTCPPWASCLIPLPFHCGALMTMLPPASRTLRLLSGFRRVGSSFHFSIFIMDTLGIMVIESGSVQSSIGELSASQFCT
jgi:hypothetical protein